MSTWKADATNIIADGFVGLNSPQWTADGFFVFLGNPQKPKTTVVVLQGTLNVVVLNLRYG
jgi:hypothetical protein